MPDPPIVTLTTDFGLSDYVAQMKGVILGYRPDVQLIDVTHGIAPQSVIQGAIVLGDIVESFPRGTLHFAVVDPGVGSDRAILYAEIGDWNFVLPDNGLLSLVVECRPIRRLIRLDQKLVRPTADIAPTFHGRDIMAHAVGMILQGCEPSRLGPSTDLLVRLTLPKPTFHDEGTIEGEILFFDSFGNAICNIDRAMIAGNDGSIDDESDWSVAVAGLTVSPSRCRNYAQQPAGSTVWLFDSQSRLELAVVNGDCKEMHKLSVGRRVTLKPGSGKPQLP
jgi:S-adenosylmethionine hydrolase